MANPCANCVYHMKVYSGQICCGYLLKTNRRRPCEPGEACTVKVPFRKRNYPNRGKKVSGNG